MTASRRDLLYLTALGLLLAWPMPYFAETRSPNELVRLYATRALIDDGTLDIDAQVARHGPLTDLARRDGRLYSDKAPGLALLGVPIYAALRLGRAPAELADGEVLRWLRFVWLVLPTLVWLYFLRRWLVGLGVGAESVALALAAYALGTTAFAYAARWLGHGAAASLCGLGLYAAFHRRPLTAGLLLAGAGLVEYPALAFIAAGAAVVFGRAPRQPQQLGAFALGAALPLGVLAAYHLAAFGSVLATGYDFLVDPSFRAVHAEGLSGVGVPRGRALFAVTFGWQRGAFVLMPWLLLAPLALLGWRRQRLLIATLGAVALFGLVVAGGFGYWLGGWSVGPRHLVATLPAWALLAALGLAALSSRTELAARLAAHLGRGLVVWSVAACSSVALTFPGFPEDIEAPLFNLTWQLLARLRGADSLGTLVGLRSDLALLVGLALAAALLVYALLGAPRDRDGVAAGLRRLVPATWIGVAALCAVTAAAPDLSARGHFRLAWLVDRIFSPRDVPPSSDPRLPEWERARARLRHAPDDAEALAVRAAASAHAGEVDAALRDYCRAALTSASKVAPNPEQSERDGAPRSSTTASPAQPTIP